MARRAIFDILVDGKSITSRLKELNCLISIDITLSDEKEGDTAEITLDDAGHFLEFPECGADCEISIGWEDEGLVDVFVGTIDDVTSEGSRGGGTELHISAKGCGTNSKAKEAMSKHWDDTTLGDVMKDAGKDAGYEVKVCDELASEDVDYEAMENESFMAFGHRMAEEYGGTFKITGKKATLISMNSGESASGKPLTPVSAIAGENLIQWSISPVVGRARYKKAKVEYYDEKEGAWKTEEVDIEDDKAEAECKPCIRAKSKKKAKKKANQIKKDSERKKGEGSVSINGEPMAIPSAPIFVKCRPGVDGEYRSNVVKHSLSRSGFTTNITLNHPKGGAGKDSRSKK